MKNKTSSHSPQSSMVNGSSSMASGQAQFEAKYPVDARFSEIEKIFSFIKAGKSVELISLPGTGRSNILGLLAFNRNVRIAHLGKEDQIKYHFVLVSFSEIKGKPLSEVIKFIFISLIDSLRLRNILKDPRSKKELETASAIFEKSVSTGDDLVIFNALKRTIDFLSVERELHIVFLFDRFEEYVPTAKEEFFTDLRSIRDRAKYKFSVVFSLKRPMEETLDENVYKSFYEFFQNNTVYLPIEDKPGLDFRIKYLEETMDKKIPRKVIDETLALTGGHAKLTRVSLEQLTSDDLRLTNDELNKLYLSKEAVKHVLSQIWKSFTPQESSFVKNFGRTKQNPPKYLVDIGLMSNDKIMIPLFEEYIKSAPDQNEKFSYDEEKREIKKGDLVISNGLTRLEFKLLRFLIQNEGQVLERDQVVNAMWGEQASTAGVTEQALDQVIFRVRKKIEENPNEPKLIQTVKGRGLQFVQQT